MNIGRAADDFPARYYRANRDCSAAEHDTSTLLGEDL